MQGGGQGFQPKVEKDWTDIRVWAVFGVQAGALLERRLTKRRSARRHGSAQKLMCIDVQKAYVNGGIWVSPKGRVRAVVRKSSGEMLQADGWLFGMRQASSAWERSCVEKLAEIGMVNGTGSLLCSTIRRTQTK